MFPVGAVRWSARSGTCFLGWICSTYADPAALGFSIPRPLPDTLTPALLETRFGENDLTLVHGGIWGALNFVFSSPRS